MITFAEYRRGWRRFKCDDCGLAWRSPSRDRFSPSVEACPRCHMDAQPHDSVVDTSLKVDALGNLSQADANCWKADA